MAVWRNSWFWCVCVVGGVLGEAPRGELSGVPRRVHGVSHWQPWGGLHCLYFLLLLVHLLPLGKRNELWPPGKEETLETIGKYRKTKGKQGLGSRSRRRLWPPGEEETLENHRKTEGTIGKQGLGSRNRRRPTKELWPPGKEETLENHRKV